MGSKPQAMIPSLEHQNPKSTQMTNSSEKWKGCRDRLLEKQEPFKGPTHKFSFAATYPGLWKRQGQSGLEIPEDSLWMEDLGRELRE